MATVSQQVTSPVGQIVQGNAWTLQPQTVYQSNPPRPKLNAKGEQIHERFIALAIQKNHPDWPAFAEALQTVAMQGYNNMVPQGFSYKYRDGDHPDYVAKDGFAGCWVVSMSTQFETKVVNAQHQPLMEESQCKCGDYVDVLVDIRADGHTDNPSLYLSPKIIRHIGFGTAIVGGPDPSMMSAAPAMPAGASAAPVATGPMPAVPNFVPGLSVNPPMPASVPSAVPPAPPQVPVSPSNPPVPAAATTSPSSVPPVPPVPTAPVMTAKAGVLTREQFYADGWTDDQLVSEGYMIAPHTGFVTGPGG